MSTELAARGIDIPDLTHVVNFELPTDAQHYVHRYIAYYYYVLFTNVPSSLCRSKINYTNTFFCCMIPGLVDVAVLVAKDWL